MPHKFRGRTSAGDGAFATQGVPWKVAVAHEEHFSVPLLVARIDPTAIRRRGFAPRWF